MLVMDVMRQRAGVEVIEPIDLRYEVADHIREHRHGTLRTRKFGNNCGVLDAVHDQR